MSAATAQHHKCLHGTEREISDFTFSTSFFYSPPLFFLVFTVRLSSLLSFMDQSTPVFLESLPMFTYLLENVDRRYCSSLIHKSIQNKQLNSLLR
jgi:hypothetical protein